AALVVAVLRGVEESWGRRVAVLRELAVIVPILLRLAYTAVRRPATAAADRARAVRRAAVERRPVPVARDVWRSPVHARRGPPLVAAA
ncbi:MAG: hypothetical protein ACRCZD_03310, partial [Phycicoccus sp.]